MAKKVEEVVSILKDALAKIEDESSPQSVSLADSIQNDLKRAFPSLSGSGKRFQGPANKGKRSASPAKKGKKSVFFIQPKESWTHDFCLLANTSQKTTPSLDELAELREAGLGRHKIVFPSKTGNFDHLKETLEKEYIKLKSQDGAFELLRAESGGISRPLRLLPMPSIGYSIPHLKNLVSNNTLIYIRPMKSCIPKDKVKEVVTASSPLTECPKCEYLIPIFSLREHASICHAIDTDEDSDKDFKNSAFETRVSSNLIQTTLQQDKGDASTADKQSQPSTSSNASFIDEGITTLCTIFPDEDIDTISQVLVQHENIELAADVLSNTMKDDDDIQVAAICPKGNKESKSYITLRKLKTKMKSCLCAERLKIDEDQEDIAIKFVQYYKSCDFDPKIPISVRYRGQPGIDSGGLLRQAFSTVFQMLANNEIPGIRLFTGPPNRVTPIYSSENLLTSIFETLGKMVGHSLVQGGPGFPYLTPAVFWYVATGDLNEGIKRAACIDAVDPELCAFLERVKEGKPGYIAEISQDPAFVNLLQECGEVCTLTENNKFQVMQSLILHATVLKHKAALDQFRKGLCILGLLSEIEKNPNTFECFFVHSIEDITAVFVKSLLRPPKTSNTNSEKTVEMLHTFIDKADHEELSAFMSFTTGSRLNTGALKPNCIAISVENSQGFFSSTCSLELKLPTVSTYSEFEILLKSVMTGNKFTTV